MPELGDTLQLERCPHCLADAPYLKKAYEFTTENPKGTDQRKLRVYSCVNCSGVVIGWSYGFDQPV